MDEAKEKAREMLWLNPEDKTAKEQDAVVLPSSEPEVQQILAIVPEVPEDVYDVVEDLWIQDTLTITDNDRFAPFENRFALAIPYEIVSRKPTFNGNDASVFWTWVDSRLEYPEKVQQYGIQGIVTLQITIDIDGQVTDVKVFHSARESISRDDLVLLNSNKKRKDRLTLRELHDIYDSLDQEAIRVVSDSPDWELGIQNSRPVKVSYTIPVVFRLD